MLETLREDFARLPELLAMGAPEQPMPAEALPELDPAGEPAPARESGAAAAESAAGAASASRPPGGDPPAADQLGLF
jgi:hypothetical protein